MNPIAGGLPIPLACHPHSMSHVIGRIDASVGVAAGGGLELAFALRGDLSRLTIPAARAPRRADGLWRHTCFEAFVMAEDGPAYRELNFSPSGEWAVHDFRAYRDGGALRSGSAPDITVRSKPNRLDLTAHIAGEALPHGRRMRIGLCAVVEDADGALSYWALRHPPGKPDFHHSDSFALHLALP